MIFEASLDGLLEALAFRADFRPNTSGNNKLAMKHFINQAIQQLSLDLPGAFHEDIIKMSTQGVLASASSSDTVTMVQNQSSAQNSENYFTFKRALQESAATVKWPNDRSRDGSVIQLIDSDGNVHTNQIRSMWFNNNDGYSYVTLTNPWNPYPTISTTEYGPLTWKIYDSVLWLPDDVIEVRSMRVVNGDNPTRMVIWDQDQAEQNAAAIDDSPSGLVTGSPVYAYRRGYFQLPAPATAPTVAAHATEKWEGPEPFGRFAYTYTLTWGKRDVVLNAAMRGSPFDNTIGRFLVRENGFAYDREHWLEGRYREPLFESPPSPESAEITVTDPGSATQVAAIQITVPNISYMLGYYFTGLKYSGSSSAMANDSDGQSGIYIRLYRRRETASMTGSGFAALGSTITGQRVTGLNALDIHDEVPYLWGEFRVDNNGGVVYDDGFIVPDYTRRLRAISGYQGFRLHPIPDDRYEIELRVVRRPQLLISGTDTVRVHQSAIKAIIDGALVLLYEKFKNPMGVARAREMYKESLQVINRRFAEMRPASQPTRRRPVRYPSSRRYGSSFGSDDL